MAQDSMSDEIREIKSDIKTLKRVVFGDEDTKEKGMKEKLDEIHTVLTQAKSMPWILGFLVLVGGAIATLKLWFIK